MSGYPYCMHSQPHDRAMVDTYWPETIFADRQERKRKSQTQKDVNSCEKSFHCLQRVS